MSQQLARQRLVSALVGHDSDPVRFRGVTGAALAGVLVAALAVGGVAVWTQLLGHHDSDDWRQQDAVVAEQESGARYVWRDGVLHPVPNFTSARLILAVSEPRLVPVPRQLLAGVPRGAALGLTGVPDALPPAEHLLGEQWMLCSTIDGEGGVGSWWLPGGGPEMPRHQPSGPAVPSAGVVPSGEVVPSAEAEQALLVRDPAGERHLLWRGHRHRVRHGEVVLPAFGWSAVRPVPVSALLLQVVPEGDELAPIEVPGRGEPSAAVTGARVGEVVVVEGHAAGPQYALVRGDGLEPLTTVQVDLLLSDPRTEAVLGQRQPRSMSLAEHAAAPQLAASGGQPSTVPSLMDPAGAAVCAGRDGGLSIDHHLPAADAAAAGEAGPLRVGLPPAGAALVSDGDTVHIVGETGARHEVDASVRDLLGYGEVEPVVLPPALVAALPEGPALDPGRAAADSSYPQE